MCVAGPILTQKNNKGSMVPGYTYSTRMVKSIVVVIHIYRALAIFLLFWKHQDNESESQKYGNWYSLTNIHPVKIIKGSMGQQYKYPNRLEKVLW